MPWNILTTASHREFAAVAMLISRDFEPYVPAVVWLIRNKHVPHGRYHETKRALFPGYVFLRAAEDQRWGLIRSIAGVTGYLHSNESPATLSDAAVDVVRQVERDWQDRKPRRWSFKIADRVRIKRYGNPFDGREGILQRLDKADRAVVLLMASNHAMAIRTEARWLAAAGADKAKGRPVRRARRSRGGPANSR